MLEQEGDLASKVQALEHSELERHTLVDKLMHLQVALDSEVVAGLSHLPEEQAVEVYSVLDKNTPRYDFLARLLVESVARHRSSLHSYEWCDAPCLEVVEIVHVSSTRALQAYKLHRQHMLCERPQGCTPVANVGTPRVMCPGACLNEYLLFHGAPHNSIETIAQSGFDPQRGGEAVGCMFGIGTYFADLSSKADFYAKPDAAGTRSIIIARVLLGNSYATKEKMPKQHRAPDEHHSVQAIARSEGGCVDHQEYIVYKEQQALPLYVLRYRHAQTCACALCKRSS